MSLLLQENNVTIVYCYIQTCTLSLSFEAILRRVSPGFAIFGITVDKEATREAGVATNLDFVPNCSCLRKILRGGFASASTNASCVLRTGAVAIRCDCLILSAKKFNLRSSSLWQRYNL